MADSPDGLRQKIAISMRILAMEGCVRHILGHVSARIPGTTDLFIRCRGGNERGLLYTDVQQIRRLSFDGEGPGLGAGFMVPHELPIHGEIYKARPDVQAVVHAHPYAAVICSIAGLELKPVIGAFDPSTLVIAARGVPLYPRSILISRQSLAAELIATMGKSDCCLMRGHGITTVGSSVEAATLLALRLETLARLTLDISLLGRQVPPIDRDDMEEFGPLIREGLSAPLPRGDEWIWAHYVELLKHRVGIPEDLEPN